LVPQNTLKNTVSARDAEMLSLPEIAISACRDVISARDIYLCLQRCYLCQR